MTLTTPYNFVPLNKKVVRPFWASLISHEKPFCDEQSGQLVLTIKAEQPIFTRNSVSRKITNDTQRKQLGSSFTKNPDGRYFIPGSSIKGSVRNVLEIMSFADLSKGLNDEIWGMRDLTLEAYKDLFSWNSQVSCGWLRKEPENSYVIEDCGLPYRITHEQIDNHFGGNIIANWASSFENSRDRNKKNLKYNFSKGTAEIKKRLFNGKNLTDTFTDVNGNQVNGTLVFTGQPTIKYDRNNKGTINVHQGESIKYKEFIFGNVVETKELTPEVVEAFEFAYHKLNLAQGQSIPVFFHKNDKGEVASFGLAYMYKIPFTHSVKESIIKFHEDASSGQDLAECIFGHIQKDNALRGRVIFGHAFTDENVTSMQEKSEVLNSPKATYYPTYVRQLADNTGKITTAQYKTLFDSNAEPSGWKRYPVHSDEVKENPGPLNKDGTRNLRIQTQFTPLPVGTTFTCTVNYHNLNKIELGALLSALTFHNTPKCYHTLGMAKPLGYGKCTITVSGIEDTLKQACLCGFEQYMEKELSGNWLNSKQLKELIAMSQDQNNTGRSELKYMSDVKDFANAKRDKLALDCYTKLDGVTANAIKGVCSPIPQEGDTPNQIHLNPLSNFNERRKQLIRDLKNKRSELVRKEKDRKQLEENQKREMEERKAEEERIAVDMKKKDAARVTELNSGINLNGVNQNKTIDVLMRTLKRWKEQLGGTIGERELNQVKIRFSQILTQLKPKDKATWLVTIKLDLPKLSTYLTPAQINKVEAFINTLS